MATQATEIRLKRLNERLRKKYRNPPLRGFSDIQVKVIKKMKLIDTLIKEKDYLESLAIETYYHQDGTPYQKINNDKLSPEWNKLDKRISRAFVALSKLESEHNLDSDHIYKIYNSRSVFGGSFAY